MGNAVTTNPVIIMMINMTVVFVVLYGLSLMIRLIHVIDPTRKKEVKAAAPAPAAPAAPVPAAPAAAAEEGIPTEVVAVIAAAVTAAAIVPLKSGPSGRCSVMAGNRLGALMAYRDYNG